MSSHRSCWPTVKFRLPASRCGSANRAIDARVSARQDTYHQFEAQTMISSVEIDFDSTASFGSAWDVPMDATLVSATSASGCDRPLPRMGITTATICTPGDAYFA